ncbi:MAG TPA: BTAD domain-containing putative transcriptional regulator, partial [Blastococcus sp.]|nr:BTAD domain-containing putative transcriptional regulator [Blastococcus sp.]
ARTRLGELRVATAEQRAEAGLAAGRHLEVIADLGPIARELPLRERPRELLIRALHECGRRTEALEVFDDFRETLIQESGTEPSPALHKLRERVLGGETGAAVARLGGRARAGRRPERVPVFTGRGETLAGLRTAVAATANGLGAALLLHGPAGIGKSALLAELLASDAVRDLRVGYAAADDLGAAYPLRLISACLTTSDRTVALAGPADEATVREAVSVIRELCATGPLVVVADDLQWADEDSLRVWRRLVGLTEELPLVLLGACRPRPGPAELERLRVDLALRGNLVVCLGPLPDVAVHTLVERLVGAPPSRELRRLVAAAAGNPFYVKEIVDKLVDEGRIVVDGADAYAAEPPELPPALVTRITDHLAFLSDETREALRWAALLGDAFTVHDLAAVLGLPLGELAGVVEESLHSGLVVESAEWLSFRHPVVRQALRQRTPASMRAVLHRHLAERLADRGAAAGRVAEQLAAARVPVDDWTGCWVAGHAAAVASDDPHLVVELLRYVVAQPSLAAELRDALTVTLARLLFWLGREPSTEARLLLARAPDAEHAAEMRWILAYLHYRHGRLTEAADEVRQALAADETSDLWRDLHLRLREALETGQPAGSMLDLTRLLDVGPLARDVSASPALARRTAPHRALPGEIHLAGAVRGYWAGRWQETTEEVGIVLRGHPETASELVRTPTSVVLVHGLAALVAGHRGDHDHARDLLLAATEPSFPFGDDAVLDPEAAAILLAATALL